MQSRQVSNFKINKMTKAQYSGIVPSQDEVYITTDEADAVLSVNGVLPNAQGNVTLNIPSAVTESTVSGWGFTKNVGTVTSVNGVLPNAQGNVTLTIPSAVTESTVAGWGFTKNEGTVTSVNGVSPTNGNVAITIPTVNNGMLTITQDGNTLGTFSANQSRNDTIDIPSGGNVQTGWSDIAQSSELGENKWYELAYGNGKYVVIGYDGYISTSTDGTTWTTATNLLGANQWRNIVFGDNKFVAIGRTGYISTSTDGITWTTPSQNSSLGNNQWLGIAYGKGLYVPKGLYVAVSQTGYVSTSEDGTTWTTAAQSSELSVRGWFITFSNDRFVALSDNGYISTSTNGTDWETATYNSDLTSKSWQAIDYGNGIFVALGLNGYISRSTNGTDWATSTQELSTVGVGWYGLAFGGDKFVTLGYKGNVCAYNYSIADLLSEKVSKSGDTMTGNLVIEKSDLPFVDLMNTSISLDELPEETKYSYVRMSDQNGRLVGGLYLRYGTDGAIRTVVSCANRDHTDSVYLGVGFDANGNKYCSFPRCTTVPTTTSTASSSLYPVIVKNYLNGDSWYRKWSDGFIEQGGKVSHTSATQTINLLQSFTTTNYNIQVTLEDSTGNRYTVQVVNSNKTTSSFQVYCGHTTNNYYWRACGY